MNPDKILSMAQTFLTPKLGAEKASRYCNWAREKFTAGNYGNGKSDLLRALRDSQVSKGQFSQMLGYLNNPIATSILGTFAPNLVPTLKKMGQEVSGEMVDSPVGAARSTAKSGVDAEFPPLRKR